MCTYAAYLRADGRTFASDTMHPLCGFVAKCSFSINVIEHKNKEALMAPFSLKTYLSWIFKYKHVDKFDSPVKV